MLRRIFSFTGITGLVVTLAGLFFLIFGGWLLALGGSPYYLPAGLLFTLSGVLIIARRPAGFWLYLFAFVVTLIWSLWEVGLDGWKLMPRLFGFALLGLWCCLPWITRPLFGARGARRTASASSLIYLLVLAGIFVTGWRVSAQRFVQDNPFPAASAPAPDHNDRDWRYYGRTPEGDRFSPASQITPQNVSKLQPAWEFHTGDLAKKFETEKGREYNFEVTPTKVGNRLYICTPHRHVIALEATSGKKIWEYDAKNNTSANEYLACRGVAYYDAPQSQACPHRIITTTADARMIALNADNGQLCNDFGNKGIVSLTDNMGKVPAGFHFITSQPLVMKDRLVLGGWVYDNQTRGEPSGVVRAYDPVSGKLAWAWDLGKTNPTAPLQPGETWTRGTPNAWGSYTADARLGLIYLPLGNATPDYYGAQRPAYDDRYSSSIVALDIETGEERWHYQTVHHDVWDFDVPIGPSLVDLPQADGSSLPALVQTTKMGQLFMLDRRTGQPLAQVTEKTVPTSVHLPGEHLSPTQPYSQGMPTLAPRDLTERDMWGATPFDQLMCRVQFHQYRYQGQYTPPALDTNIAYPAFDGVVDWHGASIDPAHHLLIANTSYIPFTVEGMRSAEAIKKGLMKPWQGWDSKGPYPKPKSFSVGPEYGTPYAAVVKPWLSVLGAPCNAPPWGKLVAIDLASKKIVWQRPVGTTRDMNIFSTHNNVPLPTGMFSIGGNIITASGLIFMGATADDYLRAFDEKTGHELWKARLPAGGQATPMTYVGDDGRQYVVIAAGGHGGLGTRSGDAVMAYALPKQQD